MKFEGRNLGGLHLGDREVEKNGLFDPRILNRVMQYFMEANDVEMIVGQILLAKISVNKLTPILNAIRRGDLPGDFTCYAR